MPNLKTVGKAGLLGTFAICFCIYGGLILAEISGSGNVHIWDFPLELGACVGGATALLLLNIYSIISTDFLDNFEEAPLSAKISTIICEIPGLPFAVLFFASFVLGILLLFFTIGLIVLILGGLVGAISVEDYVKVPRRIIYELIKLL